MSIRFLVSSALLLASRCHAIAVNLGSRGGTEPGTVCVSLAAYEDSAYIEALIQNFLHFSEPSTKVAIHFNKDSEYNGTEKGWASNRIAITSERVAVRPYQGSVLYSHMLNAKTMEKTWPGECKYWVLQASNMMWVRKGMEERVREYEFSPIGYKVIPTSRCAFDSNEPDSTTYVGFAKKLVSGKNLYGKGLTDGSFFPMDVVNGFVKMMDQYLRQVHDNGEGIYDAKCYFENVWLQTYAINWERSLEQPESSLSKSKTGSPLCLMYSQTRADNLEIENQQDKLGKKADSIPMSDVVAVSKGNNPEYEGYFAVKRVNRDMTHPITRYILGLSQ